MRPSPSARAPWTGAASRVPALAALAAAAVLTACDVAWGGANMKLEDPAPKDTASGAAEGAARPEPVPDLPSGRLLYVARLDPTGRARAAPAARLSGGELRSVDWPEDPPSAYLDRFHAAFQPPGAELALLAHGRRIGTLVLGAGRTPVAGSCPAMASGQALLPPERRPPEFAFVVSPRDSAPAPEAGGGPAETSRLRVFAPILAERLLQEAGVEQEFLARRVDLRPVAFPGDTAAGMAATFLIRDSLKSIPPPFSGTATSLFFLARYEPSEGFVPVWSRVRSYDTGENKDVLTHLGWIRTRAGPLHLVRRITTGGSRLAAFRVRGGAGTGELAWVESDACPALEALSRSTPRAAPAAPPDSAS